MYFVTKHDAKNYELQRSASQTFATVLRFSANNKSNRFAYRGILVVRKSKLSMEPIQKYVKRLRKVQIMPHAQPFLIAFNR